MKNMKQDFHLKHKKVDENAGHAMRYKILTDDTQMIIIRSCVRPVTFEEPNYRADIDEDEVVNGYIWSKKEEDK